MTAHLFDQVAKALSLSGARRRVLRLLASLPLAAGLASLVPEEPATAGRHRRQRNARHPGGIAAEKKRKKKKHKKKKCKSQPLATTCTGKCGTATNNCKK